MVSTVIVKERLYIPKKLVQLEDLKAAFERHVFNDSGCARCTVYKDGDRFCDICATCEHYRGFYKTWFKKELDGKIYYAVPFGDRRYIIDSLGLDFDKVKVDDRRKKVKAKNPLTFEHELYDGTEVVNGVTMANQKKLVAKYAKYKFGIMKSAPRTGKTVCFTKLICDMGMRTLILADERELLRQAIKTIRRFTNVRELEKETGRKIVGIIQKPSDWAENWDIVLAPYQMFIREGSGTRRLKKYVVGKFGAVWVDEVHKAAAKHFAKVVNETDARYRCGVTATDKRKDGLEFLIKQILGPVTAENFSVSLVPTLHIHETKCKPKYEWKGRAAFVYATSWQVKTMQRNVQIVKQVFADLRANKKNCIVIPVARIEHCKTLVKMINKQAKINNAKRGEKWDEFLAMEYHGKTNRKDVLAAAREGKKTRVIVGYRTMVEKGVDVPVWNIMYMQLLMANDTNFYQMSQRICTPQPGKPAPILRYYVDDLGLSKGCFGSTFRNSILKYKYKMSDETRERAYELMSRKKAGIEHEDKMMADW